MIVWKEKSKKISKHLYARHCTRYKSSDGSKKKNLFEISYAMDIAKKNTSHHDKKQVIREHEQTLQDDIKLLHDGEYNQ
jgi:hypothetical protein